MIDTWEKVLDPNFINAELIGPPGAERVVTIKDIDYLECFDMKTQAKTRRQSISFEECKPMVLNKINTKTLIKLFGGSSVSPSECAGKKITLYVANVKFAGKNTTGIRIKEYVAVKCEECGSDIKATKTMTASQVVDYSKQHTGKVLCINCMRKLAKQKEEKDDQ